MNNILMNTEMTKAILDGRKVQTRKVIKAKLETLPHGYFNINMSDKDYVRIGVGLDKKEIIDFMLKNTKTKYQVGEILNLLQLSLLENGDKVKFATGAKLKITNVRVEKLWDLSIYDIIDEGCPPEYTNMVTGTKKDTVEWYKNLWNKTAPKGYKWEDNPYIFVYEFERVEK